MDQLMKFYHLLYVVKSSPSLLADCSPDAKQSRRLLRLVKHVIARRQSAGLCQIVGQLERLGGPAAPSLLLPRMLRRSRSRSASRSSYLPELRNRAAICRKTLNISRELCTLLSWMRNFYRRCSAWSTASDIRG